MDLVLCTIYVDHSENFVHLLLFGEVASQYLPLGGATFTFQFGFHLRYIYLV